MEDRNESISYFVHEGEMSRMERNVKRLFITWIITFAALIITNACWIYYESQFTDSEISQVVDTGEGDATVIGVGVGDYYGEGKTNNQNPNTQSRR